MVGLRSWVSAVGCAFLLSLPLACGGGAPQSDVPANSASRDAAFSERGPDRGLASEPATGQTDMTFLESPYGPVGFSDQAIELPLPEPRTWRALASKAGFSGVAHPATRSELWVRHTVARRTVSISECRRRAREEFREHRVEMVEPLEDGFETESGYGGIAQWGRTEGRDEWRLEAHAVGTSRCLSVLYLTKDPRGAALRTRVVLERIVSRVRRLQVDDRVGR